MTASFVQLIGLFSLVYFLVTRLMRRQKRLLRPLHDKAVLITGCDSGFGHELAHALDKEGVTVFAGCLFPDGSGALELTKTCSNKLQVIHLDVTKDDHVHTAIKTVSCSLGANKLWAVVNNAGIATFGEVEWTPVEVFQKMFDVNTLGAVRVTQAFLPLLRRSRGRIIFVTSLAGYHTFPGTSAYSMSKFSLVSLADALRCEMRKWSISVHTVSPTMYRTNISKEDILLKDLQAYWNQLSEDIRYEYGGRFFTRYQETLRSWLKRSREETKISEVVEDLVNAVIGAYPKIRYVPGMVPKIHNWFLSHLPSIYVDQIVSYGMPDSSLTGKRQHLELSLN